MAASCTASPSEPAVGDVIVFSAKGLGPGGPTHLYLDVVQAESYTYDMGNIGPGGTYTFSWPAQPVGATITARFTTEDGTPKCECRVQVAVSQ